MKPKSVKVLNLTFQIAEKDVIEFGSTLVGQIDHIKQEISLLKHMKEERKKKVLIHEILHSVLEQLGFQEEHQDEQLINCLSTAIFQLMLDNPELFTFS